MQEFILRLKLLSPVWLTFLGSLSLSLVAILGAATVAKDAAFYLDISSQVAEHGPKIAFKAFDWPWFSLLLAASNSLLGLPLELAAYLWCALFMAGACALAVACIQRVLPSSGYWACLVVLSVPAFNEFREDILREFGFWFFSLLALWLALLWYERGGWLRALLIHLAIGAAALFRLEAIMLIPALSLWQVMELRQREGGRRLLQLNAAPVLLLVVGLSAFVGSGKLSQGRVEYYLELLNPAQLYMVFTAKADALAQAVLRDYMYDQAGLILFVMLLATLLMNFFMLCGPLALSFLSGASWPAFNVQRKRFGLFTWAAIFYAGVLLVFFIQRDFIISRYVSFLHFLFLPLLTTALMLFCKRFPKLGRILIAALILQMLANVISLSAKKTHYIEAGEWLSLHVDHSAAIFYDDARIAYYAGWGYPMQALDRGEAMAPEHAQTFRYFVIEAKADEPWLQEWLAREQREVLASFANRKGKSVLVIGD